MKNVKLHLVSILVIAVMGILLVGTSKSPPKKIGGRLNYSIENDFLIIKIETKGNPRNSQLYDNIYLYDKNGNTVNGFYKYNSNDHVLSYDKYGLKEDKEYSEDVYYMYADGKYLIIKINTNYIESQDYVVEWISLDGDETYYVNEDFFDNREYKPPYEKIEERRKLAVSIENDDQQIIIKNIDETKWTNIRTMVIIDETTEHYNSYTYRSDPEIEIEINDLYTVQLNEFIKYPDIEFDPVSVVNKGPLQFEIYAREGVYKGDLTFKKN
jgi:hypothetical protein